MQDATKMDFMLFERCEILTACRVPANVATLPTECSWHQVETIEIHRVVASVHNRTSWTKAITSNSNGKLYAMQTGSASSQIRIRNCRADELDLSSVQWSITRVKCGAPRNNLQGCVLLKTQNFEGVTTMWAGCRHRNFEWVLLCRASIAGRPVFDFLTGVSLLEQQSRKTPSYILALNNHEDVPHTSPSMSCMLPSGRGTATCVSCDDLNLSWHDDFADSNSHDKR